MDMLIAESGGISAYDLSRLYRRARDVMRDIDGLAPQESFTELLRFLFFK